MKKILVTLMFVLLCVGVAFAAPNGKNSEPNRNERKQEFSKNNPEIRDKMREAKQLRYELKSELLKEKPDNAKAVTLYDKLSKVEKEISDKRFEYNLKNRKTPCRERRNCNEEKKGSQQKNRQMKQKNGRDRGDGEFRCVVPPTEKEINEIKELREEMRTERKKETPDENKLRELHEKLQAQRRVIKDREFKEILKNPHKYQDSDFFCGRKCR
ncbi:MAG: hypothetical protein RR272_02490 [Synergistaceae bacterium]